MKALGLNNTIVAVNDSVYYNGRRLGNIVEGCLQSGNFSGVKPALSAFKHTIDAGRQQVAKINMPDVPGSEELKQKELELLDIQKKMAIDDFQWIDSGFSSLRGNSMANSNERMLAEAQKEEVARQSLLTSQFAFARANGFTLKLSDATATK